HNLSSDASCSFLGPGSINSTMALVGPLADNGGPTPSVALLHGSPAINAADAAGAPPVDQRGLPRPVGPAADIGAYEYGSPGILKAELKAPGQIEIVVTGVPGGTCQLLTGIDFLNWTPIATNQFGLDGTLVFHDEPSQTG